MGGEGRKKLNIPNWDIDTNKYCLKVEKGNGEEVSPDDYYKISFHVSENKGIKFDIDSHVAAGGSGRR